MQIGLLQNMCDFFGGGLKRAATSPCRGLEYDVDCRFLDGEATEGVEEFAVDGFVVFDGL